MSDSMIERVARSLCIEAGEHPDIETPFNPNVDFVWQYYRKSARAAIEAMRLPTESMLDAGDEADGYDQYVKVWEAMIDAALKTVDEQ